MLRTKNHKNLLLKVIYLVKILIFQRIKHLKTLFSVLYYLLAFVQNSDTSLLLGNLTHDNRRVNTQIKQIRIILNQALEVSEKFNNFLYFYENFSESIGKRRQNTQ